MLKKRILAACFIVALTSLAMSSNAQTTVYNNFGPGNGGWDYNYGLGWTVAGENVPAQYGVEQAMGFTATASGTVSDIWLGMWYVPIDPQVDVVTIRLTRNPNGQPPTMQDVMEEWTLTEFESWSQWNPPHHLRGKGTSYLENGESYWIWASGGDTTWCGWCMNIDPSLTCPHTMRREGENWLNINNETASVFRVDVVDGTGLAADATSISAAAGGAVDFALDAGTANAGRKYIIVGSASGISPGWAMPGGLVTLPVNPDFFTDLTLAYLNTALFNNFLGNADSMGQATAQLNTGGPLPSVAVGTVLYFAYTMNNPFDIVSNPMMIEIVQ